MQLFLEHIYLKSWWRALICRLLPLGYTLPSKCVKIHRPFVNNEVCLPEYKVRFYMDLDENTICSEVDPGSKVVAYDLRTIRVISSPQTRPPPVHENHHQRSPQAHVRHRAL